MFLFISSLATWTIYPYEVYLNVNSLFAMKLVAGCQIKSQFS